MKKRTVAIALVALLAVAAVPTIAFASAQGGATTTEPVVARGIADSAPAAQKASMHQIAPKVGPVKVAPTTL